MNNYIFYTLAFRFIELLAAAGIVFLVAGCWETKPDSSIIRFIRHRYQIWFALILFFLPVFMGRMIFLRILLRPTATGGAINFSLVESAILDLLYGVIYGLVGCLLATTKGEERFRHWLALGIATASIFLLSGMPITGGFIRIFSTGYVPEFFAALVFLTFMAARAFPEKNSGALPDDAKSRKLKSPAPALTLAFLPSVMVLSIIPFAKNNHPSAAFLIVCCVISIICCFTSSFMLFRRGTGLAIFGGILFLLLNAAVSFFFGCGAILTQMKF